MKNMKPLSQHVNESLNEGSEYPEIGSQQFYRSITKQIQTKSKNKLARHIDFSQMKNGFAGVDGNSTDKSLIEKAVGQGYLVIRYSPAEDSLNKEYMSAVYKDDVQAAIKLIEKEYKVKYKETKIGRPHSTFDKSMTTIDSYLLFK